MRSTLLEERGIALRTGLGKAALRPPTSLRYKPRRFGILADRKYYCSNFRETGRHSTIAIFEPKPVHEAKLPLTADLAAGRGEYVSS